VASKSVYQATEKGAEIEEQLDNLEALLERLRATYEQYFLGIQKLAPSQLHTDAERKVRDLTQVQIKNTALRYRFATLSQKFGAYNMYWKRTLRMIEQGRYVRDLQRIKRAAEKSGEEIPEEILAAMPKMMRERVMRDRANVKKVAERQGKIAGPTETRASARTPGNVHRLDEALVPEDVDVDGLFAQLTKEAEDAIDAAPIIHARPPKRDTEASPPPAMPEPEPEEPTRIRPPINTTRPPPLPSPRPRTTQPAAPAAARPGTPPVGRTTPPTGASALGPPPGMSDAETRALYTRYLKARELCGEKNEGVTYDKLLRTLRSQSTKIMTDHKAKGVEFGVVIKDNKVVLKAKPKI
jgi:hypothetical protein